jgi:hypothetical protein
LHAQKNNELKINYDDEFKQNRKPLEMNSSFWKIYEKDENDSLEETDIPINGILR